MRLILAAILSLRCLSASAEPLIFRVVVTSVDPDVFLVKPDPAFHQQRGQGYIRTQNCEHQAEEDEPAVIVMSSLSDNTAMLAFGPEEVCTVINVSMDRGSV